MLNIQGDSKYSSWLLSLKSLMTEIYFQLQRVYKANVAFKNATYFTRECLHKNTKCNFYDVSFFYKLYLENFCSLSKKYVSKNSPLFRLKLTGLRNFEFYEFTAFSGTETRNMRF